MTAAPDAPTGPPPGTLPAPAAERGRLAVAAVVVLVVVLLGALALRTTPLGAALDAGGCTVLAGERDVRPPEVVRDAAAQVHEVVGAGTATVTTTCRLVDPAAPTGLGAPDPAADPAAWEVGVDAEVGGIDALPAAAEAVLGAVTAGPGAWRLDVHDAARTLAVGLAPGDDADLAVDALAVRRVPGVAEVWFGPEAGRVVVAGGEAVADALAAVAGRELPVTTVEAFDHWLEVTQVHPGAWPDAEAVALAVDVAAWEGVWRVVLSGGEPASPDLTVAADDDAHRSHVASRLASVLRTGPPLGYHVRTDAGTVDGVLAGLDAAGADAPDAGAADASGEAPPAGVPACTGDGLRLEVAAVDAALGARFLVLRARWTGAAPCVLSGVPTLAFTRESGTRTPDLTQLPDLVAPDVPPQVVLEPGAAALAQVRWRAMSTSQDPDVAVGVTVRAVADGPAVDLVPPVTLDVLAGGTVEVGPWRFDEGLLDADG
ncbi:DUF4232 domain-containing protein [Cellulomonas wangsupingiae]|uniref:DUF4232 domain-containing protein n=1 Tax=Cellulomonas wangsupingiae TaxID=2968085 RepID=UPI0027E0F218|nr:DUF4232 domain-containing protein [Cellulomonas wangsupingiae]